MCGSNQSIDPRLCVPSIAQSSKYGYAFAQPERDTEQVEGVGRQIIQGASMRFTNNLTLVLTLLSTVLFSESANAQGDKCGQWGNVIDTYQSLSTEHEFRRARDAFCRVTDSISSYSDARSAANKAGIDYADIFGFSFEGQNASTTNSFSSWHDAFCRSSSSENQKDYSASRMTKSFSENALKAALACYENNNVHGLKGKIEIDKNKKLVRIEARYVGDGVGDVAELDGTARVIPREAVSQCNPDNLFDVADKRFGTLTQTCVWDSNFGFSIQLQTKDKKLWPPLVLDSDPPPKAGDVINSTNFIVEGSPNCADPENSDKVECGLQSSPVEIKSEKNTFRVFITGDMKIQTSAPGKGKTACSGTTATTDPWRAGFLIASCGKSKKEEYTRTTERNQSPANLHIDLDMECRSPIQPLVLKLAVRPRGCSTITNTKLEVRVLEIKS